MSVEGFKGVLLKDVVRGRRCEPALPLSPLTELQDVQDVDFMY